MATLIPELRRLASTIARIERDTRGIKRLAEDADRQRRWILDAIRRSEALERALVRLGWPPPGKLAATFLDRVVDLYDRGELTSVEIDSLFVRAYDAETLRGHLSGWFQFDWLQPRVPILAEGIDCHIGRQFFSAVSTLLPQVEGVLGDFLGRAPNPKQDAGRVFADSRLTGVAREFYLKVATASFKWGRSADPLSRNSILHGHDTAFGTEVSSLKIILVLDAVIDAVEARRHPAPSPEPYQI